MPGNRPASDPRMDRLSPGHQRNPTLSLGAAGGGDTSAIEGEVALTEAVVIHIIAASGITLPAKAPPGTKPILFLLAASSHLR